jgi:hypothetical protein
MCSAFDRDGNGVLDRAEWSELVGVIATGCAPRLSMLSLSLSMTLRRTVTRR